MKRTKRGFAIYADFSDLYGDRVKIIRSSLADKRAVWIFPEARIHLGQPIAGAHLTVKMAKSVIKALQLFTDGKE